MAKSVKIIKSARDQKNERARRRFATMLVGGFAALLIGFTLTPAFAAIVAKITNDVNTATSGALTMEESSGAATCSSANGVTNSATCSTINKYGGTDTPLIPGGTAHVTDINLKNTGSIAATSFSLTPSACENTASDGSPAPGTANLCDKINVNITSNGTQIYNGSAKSLADGGAIDLLAKLGLDSVAANQTILVKFTVSLDTSADSTYQGLKISQPLAWQFGA